MSNSGTTQAALQGLNELEIEIMNFVWEKSRITVRSTHEHLLKIDYVPYTTVMATMARLSKIGLLEQHKSRRAYRYSCKIGRVEFAKKVLDSLIARILKGNADALLTHILEIDDAQIDKMMGRAAPLIKWDYAR